MYKYILSKWLLSLEGLILRHLKILKNNKTFILILKYLFLFTTDILVRLYIAIYLHGTKRFHCCYHGWVWRHKGKFFNKCSFTRMFTFISKNKNLF